jgi:hypothetical protein
MRNMLKDNKLQTFYDLSGPLGIGFAFQPHRYQNP